MLDAFYTAAVGLEAQQQQLNSAANNFANLTTTAYKRQTVDFSAILARGPASARNATEAQPVNLLHFDMTPGAIRATGRPLDLAIQGSGFIEVTLAGQKTGYSRGGSLQINSDGVLSLSNGQTLKADVRIPTGATNVQILPDGSVTVFMPGETTARTLGQLEIVTFANPDALTYSGDGIFTLPEGASEPTRTRPGEEGTQPLVPQSLEGSNVDMTTEMVSMTLMQRVYELNSRVAQVADELMGMANNMRRE